MSEGGILAIWNDCAPGEETAYEAWYQGEHLIERLGIPGFLRGRRYEVINARRPQFFTYYETVSADVLTSPAYRSKIDNPTPETARIMSGVFTGMSRTICKVANQAGRLRGSVAVTAELANKPALANVLDEWTDDPAIARAELWLSVDEACLPASREEELRGGDDKIAACLFIETLRADAAKMVVKDLEKRFAETIRKTGIYRLLCELTPEVPS